MTDETLSFDPVATQQIEGPQAFDPLVTNRVNLSFSSVKNKDRKKDLLPAFTQLPKDQVHTAIETDADTLIVQEAQNAGRASMGDSARETFDNSFENGEDPEQALLKLQETIGNDPFISRFVDPTVLATVLSSDNDLAKKSYTDKFRKVLILADVMNEKQESADSPWWRDFDFVEMVVSELPVLTNINTNRRIEIAEEIESLLSSNQTEAEFTEAISSLMDEVLDQGILSDNNKFFLNDLFALLSDRSGSEAANQQLLSWFDTVTAGAGTAVALRPARLGLKSTVGHEMSEVATDTSTLLARSGAPKEQIKETLKRAIGEDSPDTSGVRLGNKTPSAITPTRERREYMSAPEHIALREIEEENQILNNILTQGLPQAVDEDLFRQAAQDLVSARRAVNEEAGTRRVIDYDVHKTNLENIFYTEILGTAKGAYFKSQRNAQDLANKVGGEVIPVGSGEFAVKVTENVPLGFSNNSVSGLKLFLSTDWQDLGKGFWGNFGSPLAQTTDRLNAILKQSEAKRAGFHKLMESNLSAARRGLKPAEINKVEKVYEELNYGRLSESRNPLSVEEFKNSYYRIHNEEMTAKQVRFYESIQEFNDTAYYLEADLLFKEAVGRNVEVLRMGDDFEIKVIEQPLDRVPDREQLWDMDKNVYVAKDSIPESSHIFSVADNVFTPPAGEPVQFIVSRNKPTRRLYHSDVLSYNPGGPRMTIPGKNNFFVKQDKSVTLRSGREVAENPSTLMAVRLSEEADDAVASLNRISDYVKANVPVSGSLDNIADGVRGLGKDKKLETFLEANNRWNPAIQTADDLADFITNSRYDPRIEVNWARDGSELGAEGIDFLPGIDRTTTIGDQVRLGSFRKGGRKNDLLIGYGGQPSSPIPALAAIERNFASTSARRAESAYITASVAGLVKGLAENPKALRKSLGPELSGLPLRAKLERLKEYINDTEEGVRFALERDKIAFRLQHQPINNVVFQRWKRNLADDLYKKTGNSRGLDAIDMYSSDPISALKGWVFDAWLGLFAWDQYFVQASQIFNIVGMSPVRGLQGAAAFLPTRFAILNGHDKVIDTTSKLVAPVLGVTPDQYKTMIKTLREDGRLITGMSITELGEESAFTGGLRKVRDKGRVFFDEGEISARITGHITASLEYLKKFDDDLTSQAARRWIAHRQDKLTNAMTSASRVPFQRAPFTQFFSYSWRIAEAMFAGSLGGKAVLSNKEKLTLASAHMALYGAAGIPAAGYLMDKLEIKYGVEVPDDYYTEVRYGAIDTILSELTGADTALSSRLAWGEGIFDYFESFGDKPFLEALGGPSFKWGSDLSSQGFRLINSMTTNEPDLVKLDLTLFARQFKSANMAHNAYVGMLTGDYIARNGGSIIKDDLSVNETVAVAFGIPLQEMVTNRKLNDMSFNDSRFEKKIGKDIDRIVVAWTRAMREEDFESANTLRQQIGLIIQALPPAQRARVMKNIRPAKERIGQTIYWAIQRDYNIRNRDD